MVGGAASVMNQSAGFVFTATPDEVISATNVRTGLPP